RSRGLRPTESAGRRPRPNSGPAAICRYPVWTDRSAGVQCAAAPRAAPARAEEEEVTRDPAAGAVAEPSAVGLRAVRLPGADDAPPAAAHSRGCCAADRATPAVRAAHLPAGGAAGIAPRARLAGRAPAVHELADRATPAAHAAHPAAGGAAGAAHRAKFGGRAAAGDPFAPEPDATSVRPPRARLATGPCADRAFARTAHRPPADCASR